MCKRNYFRICYLFWQSFLGNSLSTNEPRQPGNILGRITTKLKPPLTQDNTDMLEYPFLTITKYPVGFIVHLGKRTQSTLDTRFYNTN